MKDRRIRVEERVCVLLEGDAEDFSAGRVRLDCLTHEHVDSSTAFDWCRKDGAKKHTLFKVQLAKWIGPRQVMWLDNDSIWFVKNQTPKGGPPGCPTWQFVQEGH